jgi:hypothetical protein
MRLRFEYIILLLVFFISCEKVVSIDLNETNPQIVIEGNITDSKGPNTVLLSKTGNYFEPSLYFPPVSNAVVVVSDNLGNIDTLKESISGTYQSSKISGVAGRTYFLKVIAEGKEYDATSMMQKKVAIDSLYALPIHERDENGYEIYVNFKDPIETGNCYRLIPRINSLVVDTITETGRRYMLLSDKLVNGLNVTTKIGIRHNIYPGDTVTIELQSIDQTIYEYYYTLQNIISSDRSATSLAPANPISNINNGSLGYFAAYSVDIKKIILK